MSREMKELVSAFGERFQRELTLEAMLPLPIAQALARLHLAECEPPPRAVCGPPPFSTDR